MPTLYYIDDERIFLEHVGNAVKGKSNIYKPYCGAGACNAFFEDLVNNDKNIITGDSFFLIDGRMSVPADLERDKEAWGKYTGTKSDVCGFAIASYLINKGIDESKIKIFSAYLEVIGIFVQDFNLKKEILLGKHDFSSKLLEDWLSKQSNTIK